MPRKTNHARNREIARKLYVDNTPASALASEHNISRQQVYRAAESQLQRDNGADNFQAPTMGEQERVQVGPLFSEQAKTGLKRFGGFIDDDYSRMFRTTYRRMQLYREMGDDPICAAVIQAVKMRLRSVGWYVETDGETDADKTARDFVEQCMDDMSQTWADSIDQALDMIQYGFQLSETVYKKRAGVKDEAGSKYDDGRIGWRKWTFIAPESLAQGQEWVFDEHGGIQGYQQNAAPDYQAVTISIEKSILFRTTINKNNPEGRSLFRAMYSPWYFKKNLEEIEAIAGERMGAGLPVIYAGDDVSKGTAKTQDMGALYNIVRNVRADEQMGVVIPFAKMGGGAAEGKGVLLELLSPPSRGVVNFHETVTRYEQRMCMVGLSQFIMLGMNQVGARALGESSTDFFTLSLVGWLDNLTQTINRYGTERLMRLNSFPGLTCNPRIVPESLTGQDIAQVAEYVNKLVGQQVITPTEDLERHLLELADLPQSDKITELWDKKAKRQDAAPIALPARNPFAPKASQDNQPAPESISQDANPLSEENATSIKAIENALTALIKHDEYQARMEKLMALVASRPSQIVLPENFDGASVPMLADSTMLADVLRQLANQPAPVINVTVPEPRVTINPQFNVPAPIVNVAAPIIPPIEVKMPVVTEETSIERDKNGYITSTRKVQRPVK